MGAREEIISEIEKHVSDKKDIFPDGIPGDTAVDTLVTHVVAREMMRILTAIKREDSARWRERAEARRKTGSSQDSEEKMREAHLAYLQACAMTDDFAAAITLRGEAFGLGVSVENRADKDIIHDMLGALRLKAFTDLKRAYVSIPFRSDF